jgi:hypothetical protein
MNGTSHEMAVAPSLSGAPASPEARWLWRDLKVRIYGALPKRSRPRCFGFPVLPSTCCVVEPLIASDAQSARSATGPPSVHTETGTLTRDRFRIDDRLEREVATALFGRPRSRMSGGPRCPSPEPPH